MPGNGTLKNRRQVVEAAEAFVRAHPTHAITIESLCGLTGVSERTLRNAFHDVRGMSPKRWLLRARLDDVHAALMRSGARSTVTAIATDYGFYELGRFACLYKAKFGESPSHTLRGRDDGATEVGVAAALPF